MTYKQIIMFPLIHFKYSLKNPQKSFVLLCNLRNNIMILPTRSPFGPVAPTGPGLPKSP